MKRNLKLLYFLTLAVLCLYVITVPAGATVSSGPYITSAWTSIGSTTGEPSVSPGSISFDPYHPVLDNVDVECESTGGCSADINFWIIGMDYPTVPLRFDVSLEGFSSDPNAYGAVSIQDPSTSARWLVGAVGNTSLVMDPFHFTVTPNSGGSWEIAGTFSIASLAQGREVQWGDSSLDFDISRDSGVPEPSSALLFVAGLAAVEFLRRRSRR